MPAGSRTRIEALDLARGVATLLMIQAHAYGGWVTAADKLSTAYAVTRTLAALALPTFLVLAGASLTLRMRAAEERAERSVDVGVSVIRRGLEVLAWGYASSLLYAAMDGHQGLDTLLRADVLHVIGLSIALLGVVTLRSGPVRLGSFLRRSAAVALIATVLCPWTTPLTLHWEGPSRYLVALVSDVRGVTRLPLIPLVAWVGFGTLAGHLLGRGRSQLSLLGLAVGGLAVMGLGNHLTGAVLAAQGGTMSRSHIAVIPNVVDYAGRGLFALGAGAWMGSQLPPIIRKFLLKLGQNSLLVYVLHIPFCYGALAGSLAGALTTAEATPWVLLLSVGNYAVIIGLERLKQLPLGRNQSAS